MSKTLRIIPFKILIRSLILLGFVLISLLPFQSYSQISQDCDEVIVRLFIEGLRDSEVSSIICENKTYISINELFAITKVKLSLINDDASIVEGFISSPEDVYIIDTEQQEIIFRDNRYALGEDDMYLSQGNLYLSLERLDAVFKFESSFIYRELAIVTKSAIELPAMKEARILERRLNLNKITNTVYVGDTLARRERPWIEFGALTYAVNTSQVINGNSFNRFQVSTGGQLLGGDLDANFVSNAQTPLTLRNFSATYKYVDNSDTNFKQFSLGNVGTNSIATNFAPLIGGQITNRSTQLRNTFEYYNLTEYTEPFWTVELYINDVLVDYTEADATGLFSFSIPVVYGRTNVDLRFFGRFGEEQTQERFINVPFSFLPPKEFEYQITAGTFAEETGSVFSQVRGSYGATRFLTLNAGTEYVKTRGNISFYPFLSTNLKIKNNLIFSSEYALGVRFKSTINYFSTSNFNIQANYTELVENQTVVFQGANRQLDATVAFPLRYKFIQGFSRFRFDYRSNRNGNYSTNTQYIYNGKIFGLSSNLTISILKNANANALYRLRGFTTFEIYNGFLMSPEILYEISQNKINYARVRIRKNLYGRGLLDFSYTREFFSNSNLFSLGLRWDFNFARTGANIAISEDLVTLGQNISGGLLFNNYDNHLSFDKNITLNRANLVFKPFLDLNDNDIKDEDEPVVVGLGGKLNKGRNGNQMPNGDLQFNSLEPYIDYYVELNTDNTESVAYKLKYDSYNITLSPNKITTIEVPVKISGEVAGYVFRSKNGTQQPFSRIKINILDEKFNTVATVLSEYDGYFSYLGLLSGNYSARVDNEQLQKIFYSTKSPVINFTIDNSKYGDILDNLEFYLDPKEPQFDLYETIVKYFTF